MMSLSFSILALAAFFLLAVSPVQAEPNAYVTNQASDDRVWVVDSATNNVIDTVTVEDIPARVAITPDGAFAYVTIVVDEEIFLQSGALRASSVASSPVFLSSFAKSSRSSSFFSNKVAVIDTETNTVTATVTTDEAAPFGIAITPDGTSAYVTHLGGGVSVIDTPTNSIAATIPVDGESLDVTITPDGAFAYGTNSTAGSVWVIDTSTQTIAATVPVGDTPSGIAITPDGAYAYVTNLGSDDVSVIDIGTNTVIDTLPVNEGPGSVAITPDGSFAYVTNQLSNDVSVIETAGNTAVATISVGDTPIDAAIRPDGAFVYVTNIFSDSVSVIDVADNSLAETVPVGFLPEGLAIAPEAAPLQVAIDVKPGNEQNRINQRSNGGVWVAVLSDVQFDALQVDAGSVRLGPGDARAIRTGVRDVDRDGRNDLLLRFDVPDAGIECGDTSVALSGQTQTSQEFSGEDSIETVGCSSPAGGQNSAAITIGPASADTLVAFANGSGRRYHR